MADDRPLPTPDNQPLPSPGEVPKHTALPKIDQELARTSTAEPSQEPTGLGKRGKIALGGLAASILIGSFALFNPWVGVNERENDDQVATDAYTSEEEEAYLRSTKEWYQLDPDEAVPVKLESWNSDYSNVDPASIDEEQVKYFAEQVEGTEFAFVVRGTLPSEESGFTSDVSEAVTPEGLPNPLYSYVTAEIFETQSGYIVERLLNPYFGGWGEFQEGSSKARQNFNTNLVSELFSDEYKKKNFAKDDKSFLPLFADWNGNNYGRDDLIPGTPGRWVGSVKDASVTFDYDLATRSYRADATYQVSFVAKTIERKTVRREGVLKLSFVTAGGVGAPIESESDVERVEPLRIKVDGGSLTVKP